MLNISPMRLFIWTLLSVKNCIEITRLLHLVLIHILLYASRLLYRVGFYNKLIGSQIACDALGISTVAQFARFLV